MEEYQDYVVDSNEAVEIKFVRCMEDLEDNENGFHPEMSHQVFGDTETIFGYKGLKVKLYYTPGWLHTYVGMEYESKIQPTDILVEADNVTETIAKLLNHDFFHNIDMFVNTLKDESSFKPYGELICSIDIQNNDEGEEKNTYESYYVSGRTHNSDFLEYYEKLQNFIMWYIDCASFIDLDDDKWQYFIMYEKYQTVNQEMAYAVVGFATVYEYYAFPSHIRPRISQVLIFPPFLKKSLGVHLVNSIYKYYMINKSVLDITVESPTPEFKQIRDFVDLCRCVDLKCCSRDNLKNGFTEEFVNELQSKLKIHKKQARKIYEILLLRYINRFNEEECKKYRLLIKRRLNASFQKASKMLRTLNNVSEDVRLTQALTKESRIDMLNKEYNELEKHYYHVIDRYLVRPIKL